VCNNVARKEQKAVRIISTCFEEREHDEEAAANRAIPIPQRNARIQAGQQGPFVFVVKPDLRVESRKVEPGRRLEREIIVTSGLKAGERVVTDGQLRLFPGALVEVKTGKTS